MAMPLTDSPADFDPLVEFYGQWNTDLAERYLPIPEIHARKYECVEGYLIMSPHEGAANSYGEGRLNRLVAPPAEESGLVPYLQMNIRYTPRTWLIPDLAVLTGPAEHGVWTDLSEVQLVAEFVSPSSRRRDRIDKPRRYAEGGIPWYLRAEVDREERTAYVRLDRLVDGRYELHAAAHDGQKLSVTEPLSLEFDPAELLEPRR